MSYVQAVVSANATFTLPPGSKMSDTEPNTVVCPNGDKLKFWVTAELVETDMAGKVEENLSYAQLTQMGMDVEYDEVFITLAETEEELTVPDAECAAGTHSWVGRTGLLPADTTCSRCGEQYGHPD